MKRILLISLWSLSTVTALYSQASFNSVNNGNWNAPATWTIISGSDADGIPDADDAVTILNGKKVIANITASCTNLTLDGAGTILTINTSRVLTVSGNVNFLNSVQTPQLIINSGGTLKLAKEFTIDGSNVAAVPTTLLKADAASVINYSGTTAQLIVATDYGRLQLSGTGVKTFSTAGVIRIFNNAANSFIPGGTTTIVTNSTINFAGSGAQTIPAFNYFNLVSSGSGSRVLASGNINIAGSFTPGTNAYTVPSNNTINYNAAIGSQTITPFDYQNLTASNDTVVLSSSGIIKVKGILNIVGTTGNTITGSTVEFNGAGSFARNTTLNNLIISGTLNLPATRIITLTGNFTNNGLFNQVDGNGKIIFSGSAAQAIAGSAILTTFSNLNINNTVGVTVSQPVEILRTLTLGLNAKLNTGDNIILNSNASQTARLDSLPAGAIVSGKLTMERFISPDTSREQLVSSWRTVCAPVTATVSDWITDFPTEGFPGAEADPTNTIGFCSIQTYNETASGILDNGFTNIAGISETITPGKGFSAFIRPAIYPVKNGPFTLSVKGNITSGNVNVPLTYTPSSPVDSADGWNLVGNPYTSAINWRKVWAYAPNKNVVRAKYYIWVPKDNAWGVYNPAGGGAGTHGLTHIIPSSTAFWVQARTNGNLHFEETYKIAGGDPYLFSPVQKNITGTFTLNLSGNNSNDEAIVAFDDQATTGPDDELDEAKFPSGENSPYLATISGNKDLTINALPNTVTEITLPLRVKVPTTGTYTLSKTLNSEMPSYACVILEDKVTGTKINLNVGTVYSFTINDTTQAPRFLIHINTTEGLVLNTVVTNSSCKLRNGKATVSTNNTKDYNFKWMDSNKVVIRTALGTASDSVLSLSPGKYSVEVSDGSLCGFATAYFEIEGEPAYNETYTVQSASCPENNSDAFIIASADTLGAPIKYVWKDKNGTIIRTVSDKYTADTLSTIEPGDYTVEITYSEACGVVEKQLTLKPADPITADFSASATNIDIKNGPAKVDFINKSVNASDFIWTFTYNDQRDSIYTTDASYTYTHTGDYQVELTASNYFCGIVVSKILNIHVYNSSNSNITKLYDNKNLIIGTDNNGTYVRFDYNENINTTITISDVLGRKLAEEPNIKPSNQTVYLKLNDLTPQVLIITVATANDRVTKKIMKQ